MPKRLISQIRPISQNNKITNNPGSGLGCMNLAFVVGMSSKGYSVLFRMVVGHKPLPDACFPKAFCSFPRPMASRPRSGVFDAAIAAIEPPPHAPIHRADD